MGAAIKKGYEVKLPRHETYFDIHYNCNNVSIFDGFDVDIPVLVSEDLKKIQHVYEEPHFHYSSKIESIEDSTDLTGWEAMGKNNQWMNVNGVLTSPKSGENIRTKATFDDFKLHIEFRYPKGSNSGVYLRGRYEIQIEDNQGKEPQNVYLGGVYGFIDPWVNAAKAAGEWQSYDVTLIGRMVTVVANGQTIIFKQEIPGITGGAINSDEAAPGPIMLQGDHGPIEYRNIIITPAKN
jgi:hypothetical protein